MISSFDIGMKNFAFAVRDINGEYILLKNINLAEGTIAPTKTDLLKLNKSELIKVVESTTQSLLSKGDNNLNLTFKFKKDMVDFILKNTKKSERNCKVNHAIDLQLFKTMDEFDHIWKECDTFLIERQMTINRQALKLSHFLEAYLKIKYANKKILNYSATLKTKKLGAKHLKTKLDRKKWTVEYTRKLLKEDNLRYFESLKKKDDIADVVCMIEAFKPFLS